jgi:hypothetical protein
VFVDLGVNEIPPVPFEAIERPLFVFAHQPRIADDIGGKYRGKAAGRRHRVLNLLDYRDYANSQGATRPVRHQIGPCAVIATATVKVSSGASTPIQLTASQ